MHVEARRPAKQEPPAVVRARAALREEHVELDDPREHEQRALLCQRNAALLDPERILHERVCLVERVAATWNRPEHVAAAQEPAVPVQRDPAFPESREPLDDAHRRQPERAARLELDVEHDVVPLHVLDRVGATPVRHRASGGVHAHRRDEHREQKADRDRVQRLGAERPRGDVQGAAEHEQQTPAPSQHQTGTGVLSSASRTRSTLVVPAARASGATISRCESTASAIAFTSSGAR